MEKVADHPDAKLSMTIDELDLSVRSFNCLKRANINTVADLIDKIGMVKNLHRGILTG